VVYPARIRAALLLNALAPGTTSTLLGLGNRLLPGLPATDTGRKPGRESSSALSPSVLTSAGERAAHRYNQIASAEAQ
jgi:hypothetical protein